MDRGAIEKGINLHQSKKTRRRKKYKIIAKGPGFNACCEVRLHTIHERGVRGDTFEH